MKKKTILFILSFLVLFTTMSFPIKGQAAEQPIKVFIDGKQISFTVNPTIQSGSTLVPFRPVFEALGLTVVWNSKTRSVEGTKSGLKISLILDKNVATVNGVTKKLDVAPKIIQGNTMVPLRFIGEAANKQVTWDGTNRVIQIGSQTKPFTFRSTTWGMSKEQVESIETKELVYEDENLLLFYSDTLSGMNSVILYLFDNNKLIGSGYLVDEVFTDPNRYINEYTKLQTLLSTLYGKKVVDEVTWYDDLYKNDSQKWGLALSNGDLEMISGWESGNTKVTLVLTGQNNEINLGLLYIGDLAAFERVSDKVSLY